MCCPCLILLVSNMFLRKMPFCNVKGHVSACESIPFAVRFAVFCKMIDLCPLFSPNRGILCKTTIKFNPNDGFGLKLIIYAVIWVVFSAMGRFMCGCDKSIAVVKIWQQKSQEVRIVAFGRFENTSPKGSPGFLTFKFNINMCKLKQKLA